MNFLGNHKYKARASPGSRAGENGAGALFRLRCWEEACRDKEAAPVEVRCVLSGGEDPEAAIMSKVLNLNNEVSPSDWDRCQGGSLRPGLAWPFELAGKEISDTKRGGRGEEGKRWWVVRWWVVSLHYMPFNYGAGLPSKNNGHAGLGW